MPAHYAKTGEFLWVAAREFRTAEVDPDPDFLDRIIKD